MESAEHAVSWYGEALPKDVNDLFREFDEDKVLKALTQGILRVIYEATMNRSYSKNVEAQLLAQGASLHQVDMDHFVDAHTDEVAQLLSQEPLGNWLTRARRFHVITRWVAEQVLAEAPAWEWIYWDSVQKQTSTHHLCLPTPDGTNARVRVMNNVWNKASDAWRYALMQLGVQAPDDTADAADAVEEEASVPWKYNKTEASNKGGQKWPKKKSSTQQEGWIDYQQSSTGGDWKSGSWSSSAQRWTPKAKDSHWGSGSQSSQSSWHGNKKDKGWDRKPSYNKSSSSTQGYGWNKDKASGPQKSTQYNKKSGGSGWGKEQW